MPHNLVDEVILVDDASHDHTVAVANDLGITTIVHEQNIGYGGNQKTCYQQALSLGADIIIMLHPDYQYTPLLITAMASLLVEGLFDCVLGSRILGIGAMKGGMPLYKYISNRFLTAVQNFVIGYKLSEYHTGYRGYTSDLLKAIPFEANSDDFVFDNQILSQIIYGGYRIGEITCPTRYLDDSSSISFRRSTIYGLGVIRTALSYRLQRWRLINSHLFSNIQQRTASEE